MKAIDVLNDYLIRKKTELSLLKARRDSLDKQYPYHTGSIHDQFEYDLKFAKLNYRIRLIQDDINYLEDKINN